MKSKALFIIMLSMFFSFSSCAKTDVSKDEFKTKSGKVVKLQLIKHGSFVISYDGLSIQVDPVEKLDPVTDYSQFLKADIILITHEHYDHFDVNAINKLKKSDTKIILNKNCEAKLGYGTAMKNGDSISLPHDIKILAFPAYNFTKGHEQYHPKGRDNAYVLSLDGLRIYIAADTEDIPEMKQLSDIDVAFLPCNQPYTMTVDQLVHAALMFKPRVLYPYHYNDTPVENIKTKLKGSGIDVRIRAMK
jgi:L-ascorbate metabolism protein UlaG (beta-lactamase superfamily)